MIDPPNIITNPVKKGPAIDSTLFGKKPTYNACGEPFQEAAKAMDMRKVDKDKIAAAGHEVQFKPAKHVRQPTNAAYEHKQEINHIQKNYKSEENPRDIMIAPRNFITNPPKKGQSGKQTYFGGKITYTEDDYNRPKAIAKAEREAHDAKLQELPFRQRVGKIDLFNSHRKVLEEDVPIPPKPEKAKPVIDDERAPFKPSNPPKVGYNKSIGKFPQYLPDPPKPVKRKVPEEGVEEPPKFKMTHNSKSRPTPSVATNLRNLKSSFPSVFRK